MRRRPLGPAGTSARSKRSGHRRGTFGTVAAKKKPKPGKQKPKPGKSGAATPAMRALHDSGVAFAVHEYSHDPDETAFGLEAASSLGLEPQRVFKTLVAQADGELVVACLPVSHQLNLKGLAAAVGAKRAVMAEPKVAEKATGYVVGGISPLGQRKHLATVVDDSALAHRTIFVSGGRRGVDIEIEPESLIAATKARTAPIRS